MRKGMALVMIYVPTGERSWTQGPSSNDESTTSLGGKQQTSEWICWSLLKLFFSLNKGAGFHFEICM